MFTKVTNSQLATAKIPDIKVLIVDDQKTIREHIKVLLSGKPGIEIVGTANGGKEGLEKIDRYQPDVVLLDLEMPDIGGIEVAKEINKKYRNVRTIVLTGDEDPMMIKQCLATKVSGYIIKSQISQEIGQVISLVHAGYMQLSPGLMEKITIKDISNSHISTPIESVSGEFVSGELSGFHFISPTQEWSQSAKDIINTIPQPWTRGVVYLLIGMLAVVIPWASFYRLDEVGTARGRLEVLGNTIKRESDLETSVAVTRVLAKKGDRVTKGQVLLELDTKNITERIRENQLKLTGQEQQLVQLGILRDRLNLAVEGQARQNQAQEREKEAQIQQADRGAISINPAAKLQQEEKLSQIRQAEELLNTARRNLNLQGDEKLAQVRQAERAIVDSRVNYNLAISRWQDAEREVQRFKKLQEQGAIPQTRLLEVESIAKERIQTIEQARASLKQAELRLQEQRDSYRRIRSQALSEVAQAELKLKEQRENYQRLVLQNSNELTQAQLKLTEQNRSLQSLQEAGRLAIVKSEQQLKEMQSRIASTESEIAQLRLAREALKKQLERYTIVADTDGVIFELPIVREGSVVQPKQLLYEIAPASQKLIFRGTIAAGNSESIREQIGTKPAKLKFDEYAFQTYDITNGKLTWVAPTSKIVPNEKGESVSYDLEVELLDRCIQPRGKCIPFQPGQPATAEIVIRQRSILDLILDPFKKLLPTSNTNNNPPNPPTNNSPSPNLPTNQRY
jgi:HlyD family secretion protein